MEQQFTEFQSMILYKADISINAKEDFNFGLSCTLYNVAWHIFELCGRGIQCIAETVCEESVCEEAVCKQTIC